LKKKLRLRYAVVNHLVEERRLTPCSAVGLGPAHGSLSRTRRVVPFQHDHHDQDRETRVESSELMKKMTCKQLGGPCDHQHQGQTADDVINAQDRHLKEMVAGGDTAHAPALKEMKGRWKHPISGMGWYRAAKRNFASLPEG
jgi:hypothetical protein